MDKEKLIKFWKSTAYGSGSRNFKRIFQDCEIGHFSIISRKKTDRTFMNNLSEMYIWTRKSRSEVHSRSGLRIWTELSPRRRSALSLSLSFLVFRGLELIWLEWFCVVVTFWSFSSLKRKSILLPSHLNLHCGANLHLHNPRIITSSHGKTTNIDQTVIRQGQLSLPSLRAR